MVRQLFNHPICKFYQSLLVISTLIFLTSCGNSSNSNNDNGDTVNYTSKIALTQQSVVEGDEVKFVISVSTDNDLEESITGVGTLTFTGSAAEDFNSNTIFTITNSGITTTATATLVPNSTNNNTSDATNQFTVTFADINVSNITTIALTIPDDSEVETTETLTITVDNIRINGTDYSNDITTSISVTIVDNDIYTLSITANQDSVGEGDEVKFVISVSTDNDLEESITGAGTLTFTGSAAEDFNSNTIFTITNSGITTTATATLVPNSTNNNTSDATNQFTVTFADINVSNITTIALTIPDDSEVETTEILTITVDNIRINGTDYSNDITTSISVTIVDNDIYTLSITANQDSVGEGENIEFTISVSPTNTSNVAITGELTWEGLATGENITLPTTFSIDNGKSEVIIPITIPDDDVIEQNRILKTTISNINADRKFFINTNTANIELIDNDKYNLSITVKEDNVIEEDTDSIEFMIRVSPVNNSGDKITGNITFTGNAKQTDFTSVFPTEFSIDNGESTTTIALIIDDDNLMESTETLTAIIDNISANNYATIITTKTVDILISDNDVFSGVSVMVSDSNTSESGTTISMTVGINAPPQGNVTATFNISDSSEHLFLIGLDTSAENSKSSVTTVFTRDNWEQVQTFVIQGQADNLVDTDVVSTITSVVISEDSRYNNFPIDDITLTNANIDETAIGFASTQSRGFEDIGSMDIVLQLSKPSISDVTADFVINTSSTATSTDYLLNTSSVTIFAGNTTSAISINILNDDEAEDTEKLVLTLVGSLGAPLGDSQTYTYTILDDDIYTLSITPKQDGSEDGINAEFIVSVSPPNETGSAITGKLTFTGTATEDDFTGLANNLFPATFSIAEGMSADTITLTMTDDDLVENTKTLTVAISDIDTDHFNLPHQLRMNTASINIIDNDQYILNITSHQSEAIEGFDSTIGFTISLSPANNSGDDLTIHLDYSSSTAIADDFIDGSSTLTSFPERLVIPNGKNMIDIVLLINNDSEMENIETVGVTIDSISSYAHTFSTRSISITLVDDDILPDITAFTSSQPKILNIHWNRVGGADSYVVNENKDGSSGFEVIARTSSYNYSKPISLIGANRVTENTKYMIESTADNEKVGNERYLTQADITKLIGYIKASNTNKNDQFGSSVALSKDGKTLVVGAPSEDSNATGVGGNDDNNDGTTNGSGAVYIFTQNNNDTWSQTAYIKASNTGEGDLFGSSVALSDDGKTLVVGAPSEDSNATGVGGNDDNDDGTTDGSGAVYIFTLGSTWSQTAYIKASNTGDGDQFGYSIALSGDGKTLAVGARFENNNATGVNGNDDNDDGTTDGSGAVYIFTLGSTWSQTAYIKASNTDPKDFFGWSTALSLDGKTLAVGATYEDSNATGVNGNDDNDDDKKNNSGAVYVFTLGSTWSQTAYIKANNTDKWDQFGYSITLNDKGTTLVVGAPEEDSNATGINGDGRIESLYGNSGAVYVFTLGSTWSQTAYIKSSDAKDNQFFGINIALDGTSLAVGAYLEGSRATGIDGDGTVNSNFVGAGAVYLFTFDSSSGWNQTNYIKASNTGKGDKFGSNVALSNDGTTLAVGAGLEGSDAKGINGNQDNNGASDSGAVYLY